MRSIMFLLYHNMVNQHCAQNGNGNGKHEHSKTFTKCARKKI